MCREKLDPRDIEYDHKKAHASGGRTKTINGRALCGSCHNKISHKQRLKKTDKKERINDSEKDFNPYTGYSLFGNPTPTRKQHKTKNKKYTLF